MAKRRRSKNKTGAPNLPEEVLARARKNAGIEDEAETESNEDASNGDSEDSAPVAERAARRRKLNTVQLERSRKRGELSNEVIEDVLHNPTIVVTEDELREDYHHVLLDLRNMGLLAAVLIAVLIGLAFVFPTF